MSAVVRAIAFGQLDVAEGANPAYYLLFELAQGDLREQVDLERRFDLAYRLRVLHNTAKGLSQLHFSQIAHQDLKPSNIVTFERSSMHARDTTKIADFGHAHDRKVPRPGTDRLIAGDPTWAPPE
jgi:serine/threonine protein kinase